MAMSTILSTFLLLFFFSCCQCRRQVEIPGDFVLEQPPLTVTAFNVQVLGLRKLAKENVMEVVKKVILQSDITLIQEIRDSTEVTAEAIHLLVNSTSDPFGYVASQRLGRTHSKEKYAFYYRLNKVELLDTYQYPDPHDFYERPPFLARFKALNINSLKDFGVLAIHTSPSDAVEETSHLVDVYDDIQRHYHSLENVLIAGDLNADCNYIDGNDWSKVKLRNDPRFLWLTSDTLDTTVKTTDCTYDRFVAAGKALQKAYIPDSSGVIRFDLLLNLTETEALQVSDHYPITLQFAGTANVALQRSLSTSTEYTVESKLPVDDVNRIRAIYRAARGTPPTTPGTGFEVEVLQRTSGGILYVTATKRNLSYGHIMPSLNEFCEQFTGVLKKPLIDGVLAYIISDVMKPSYVYGLDIEDTRLFNLEVHCRVKDPLTCKVIVALQTSD